MKRDWGSVTTKIQNAFEIHGEMTRQEVCDAIGLDRMYVSAIISRMSKATKTLPKRLHIVRYIHDQEGERSYPRAVYAAGDGVDAKRPKSDKKAIRRRYEENLRKRMTTNSVFNLALTRREYKDLRKAA